MYKNLFSDFDKIKAPKSAVDETVRKALSANDSQYRENVSERNVATFRKRRTVCILCACLALVFVCTAVFGMRATSVKTSNQHTGFIITANAKQVENLGDTVDDTVVGAYTDMITGGWAMYPNLEKYEDFSPNFFQSYAFTQFSIEGEGIKSVTLKSNSEGTYFANSPAGFFNTEENASEYEQMLKRYSDFSLTNSQYSAEELTSYSDGLAYGNIYCDTFTYTNSDNLRKIDFGNKLEFVIESNHKDEAISTKLDRLWECEQELLTIRGGATFEGGEISEKEEMLYKEMDLLTEEIRKLVLANSTVDVIVRFTDGTQQTKTLNMGLVKTESGLWLTVSE